MSKDILLIQYINAERRITVMIFAISKLATIIFLYLQLRW